MPLGIKQNNNLLYLTLDVWQDLVFLNEQAYPAGYFAANIMNQDQAILQALIHYGGAISKEAEALVNADRDTFAQLLPQVRSDVSALLDVLWTYPPFCFLDKSGELEVPPQNWASAMAGSSRLLHPLCGAVRCFFSRSIPPYFEYEKRPPQ